MDEITDKLFKSKFWRAIGRSAIITALFFATVDQFVTIVTKNIGVFILAIFTFYLLFNLIAFNNMGGIKNDK